MPIAASSPSMQILRLKVASRGGVRWFAFDRFPVRIGRDAGCDCRLEHASVSRVHARLEVVGERILLCDMGSRHGTWISCGSLRLVPNRAVDLAPYDNAFCIARLSLRAELSRGDDEDEATTRVVRPGESSEVRTTHYADQSIDPRILDASALETSLRVVVERVRSARAELIRALEQTSALGGSASRRTLRELLERGPMR